jgi:spermidine/putrescine transport system ATP-binding protein
MAGCGAPNVAARSRPSGLYTTAGAIMSFKMHGQEIELIGCSMRFNEFTAVQPTDLTIRAGEFFSILGPSGCGKTTILRADLRVPGRRRTGDVLIGGQIHAGDSSEQAADRADLPEPGAVSADAGVGERHVFGLEAKGASVGGTAQKARARFMELLRMLPWNNMPTSCPRTALGRAEASGSRSRGRSAAEPAVLLLDEPLSALDLKLRQHMRAPN